MQPPASEDDPGSSSSRRIDQQPRRVVRSLISDQSSSQTSRLSMEQSRLKDLDLNDLQRLRLIGRGDVGTVFLVRHKGTGLLYALKVMSKAEMIKRNKIHRVLTEREILATAASPFILSLHGSCQDDLNLYLLLDWAPGGEFWRLSQRLPGRRFPEPIVRFYAAEVLQALDYLHQMGVVYRDLKPENILLQANGHVCIADFDLSKQIPVNVREARVSPKRRINFSLRHGFTREESFNCMSCGADAFATTTNSFVGTAEYLAPEVIKGTGHTGIVDFWALGVLIFELLTGRPPFVADAESDADNTELFSTICEAKLVWPDDAEISREARSLVKKLLRANPAERLGATHGAAEIKHHAFFRDVKWSRLHKATPPLRPARVDPDTITPDPALQGSWQDVLELRPDAPAEPEPEEAQGQGQEGEGAPKDHFAAFGVSHFAALGVSETSPETTPETETTSSDSASSSPAAHDHDESSTSSD